MPALETKKFESIEIDITKGIYILNGERMKGISELHLEFSNLEWTLLVTQDKLYSQTAPNSTNFADKPERGGDMKYSKQIMTITEVVKELGFPRELLKRYVHIKGFPAKKQSPAPNSPFLIDMEKFVVWYEKYGGRV